MDGVIEAFDRADQKAMLLQAFTAQKPAVPFIGASGMAGFGAEETIGVKKMGANKAFRLRPFRILKAF
ncbi:MAG: hypothetical protein WC334_08720 [Kiritimatiellales bacterium]